MGSSHEVIVTVWSSLLHGTFRNEKVGLSNETILQIKLTKKEFR